MKAKDIRQFEMTAAGFEAYRDEYAGFCTICGAEASCVEPDARHYECESCGEPGVFGVEELLMMGHVRILED